MAAQIMKEREADIERLEGVHPKLRTQHKLNPNTVAQLDTARLELNMALTAKAEKQVSWSKNKFYTQRDRMGSMLAAKLTSRIRLHNGKD